MKIISHRGNLNGSNPDKENQPSYLEDALFAGYDIELDVWKINDNLFLGHDTPQYPIKRNFLQNKRVWCHCKNIDAYIYLYKFSNINCFYQTNEDIVMTSRGYLWAHSNCKKWDKNTIITRLDGWDLALPDDMFAVCSDYAMINTDKNNDLFDLLIIDIDGVMTDGTKMYDQNGRIFGKNYCDLDFTAIKRFKAAGINVCFLSGDRNINVAMAETRKIDFFHNPPGIDKTELLQEIKNIYNPKKIAYVGDDYYDLAVMQSVDFAFCPRTSFKPIKNIATIIDVDAGKGVIAGLYDIFEDKISYAFPIDSHNVNP